MIMSQDFKFNFFDEPNAALGNEGNRNHHATPANARNVCFCWPDGRMKFINYAYLISGEYVPESGTIVLRFSTELVELNGSHLLPLFNELMQHLPKLVKCSDARYNATLQESETVINDIIITNNS